MVLPKRCRHLARLNVPQCHSGAAVAYSDKDIIVLANIDLGIIVVTLMYLVWDERKRQANLEKHGLDFADLTIIYFGEAFIRSARDGRWKAIGWFEGTCIAVIFKPLEREGLALVSMRIASRAERRELI